MADLLLHDRPGQPLELRVAQDVQGNYLIRSKTLPFIRPSTPVGEATYSNTDPTIAGVYASDDLSDGLGQKFQVAGSKRYWYGSYIDPSIPNQIQPGPALTELAITGYVSGMEGHFILGGVPYFVLGKVIASWASDSLTSAYSGSYALSGGATFFVLGNEANIEASSTGTTDQNLQNVDALAAQQFRHSASTVQQISKVVLRLKGATTTAAGDVRAQLYTDIGGVPGESLASARVLYKNIGTSAADVTFRLEDDTTIYLEPNAPYWIVLDMASADSTNYIAWQRDGSASYTRGDAKVSADGGNAWTAASGSFRFVLYGRTATEKAFVGSGTASTFITSPDGTNWTADSYRKASYFKVVADRLVSDVAGAGAIRYTDDGVNWSESYLVGSPSTAVTGLYDLNGTLVVAKTDSIWAVDIASAGPGAPPDMQPLYAPGSIEATNGRGGDVWRGVAYIPFAGHLLGIEGNFDGGFVLHEDCGPDNSDDWGGDFAINGTRCVVGDRFALYAVSSNGSAGSELFKSFDPLGSRWHGSIARFDVRDLSVKWMFVYDPGGVSSPHLFGIQTTDTLDNLNGVVGRLTLSRTKNPANDSNYRYNTTNQGLLYYSVATGNFPANPKGWFTETLTYSQTAAGDSAEMLYDLLDGKGLRLFAQPWHRTGTQTYPEGLLSTYLARVLRMTTTTATTSAILSAAAVEFNVRRTKDLRAFTVVIEDARAARQDVSMAMGASSDSLYRRLLAATRAGTMTLSTLRGEKLRVTVQDVDESVTTLKQMGSTDPASQIAVTMVQVS